jgi:hypothetical protein
LYLLPEFLAGIFAFNPGCKPDKIKRQDICVALCCMSGYLAQPVVHFNEPDCQYPGLFAEIDG